jgi:cysteine desulfurase
MKKRVYLDYNATTPQRAEVINKMTALMHAPHNASSVHAFGRDGRKAIEHAREHIAALVNAPAAQIIFNSGATEGNNTVLNHFKNERIIVSAIEHPSVLEATPNAQRISITKDGIVDLAALEALLKKEKTALVSIMAVNNETGVIQPIERISALVHSNGALFHCDGVQAAGRIPLDITKMGIDFLTLSAHKIGGPQGTGALILGLCGITPTLLQGGGQEKRARAGTENVAGIAGFGVAAELALKELPEQKRERFKKDR